MADDPTITLSVLEAGTAIVLLDRDKHTPILTSDYVCMDSDATLPATTNRSPGEHDDDPPHDGTVVHDKRSGGDDPHDDSSMSPSILTSVLSAEGIYDTTGFACVCLVILLGDMNRGMFFPSLWPLVEYLGGNTVVLGYAVAAFPFGRIMVNPVFGTWSHTLGYSKTLLLATIILLIGTVLYSQVCRVGTPAFLILSQTVLGIGSGTLGVTRAFVADVTAKRNRTTYMAWVTAVQYAGFTVTPILGALFNWMYRDVTPTTMETAYKYPSDDDEDNNSGGANRITNRSNDWIQINMFTAPAYLMGVLCVITIVTLLIFFQDRQRITVEKEYKLSHRHREKNDIMNQITWIGFSVYDCCIIGCMLLNIPNNGSFAVFETMGIAVAEANFHLMSTQAGLIVGSCGALGVICLLQMGRLTALFSDVQLLGGGMLIMSVGIFLLSTLDDGEDAFNPTWKFIVSILLVYSIGFPIGHTSLLGLFSKSKNIVTAFPPHRVCSWLNVQSLLTILSTNPRPAFCICAHV